MNLRASSLVVGLVLAVGASAQFRVSALTGDIGGGGVGTNASSFILTNGGSGTGSMTLRTDFDGSVNGRTRGVAVFRARNFGSGNNASWMLPSDRIGGMSSAMDGDTRRFATWDFDQTPGVEDPGHEFNMSVTADDGQAEAWADFIDVSGGVNYTTSNYTMGSIPRLDNSVYDLNPAVGAVVIDKNATPVLSLAFTSSSLSVSRKMLNDGSEDFASPFYDFYFTRPFAFFFNGSNSATITGDSGETAIQQINPGEDDSVTLSFGQVSGTVTVDLSGLANGTYTYINGTTVQNPQGLDDPNYFPNGWNGYYTDDFVNEQVTVVPEPMTMTIMAIAGIISARRRRRQQSV
jgi:hypothetical protein